jgi:acetolactate synthase-1/2/3 large subunit
MSTPRGLGIDDTHEQFIGSTGNAGRPATIEAFLRYDPEITLVLGTQKDEASSSWMPALVPRGGFVHVDIDDAALCRAYPHAPTFGVQAAGAETVIGGLWDFPDLATALIVARMYAHLGEDQLWQRPEVALRSAQRWLRDHTREALRRGVGDVHDEATWIAPELAALLALRLAEPGPERPFADPSCGPV